MLCLCMVCVCVCRCVCVCHVTCVHMCVGVTDNFPLTHPPPLSQAAKSNQSNLPRRLGEDSEVLSPLWPTVPPSLAFVSTRARLSPAPPPFLSNPKQGRLYCFIAFQEDVPTVLTISCRKACSFEKENSRRSGDLGMLLSRWLFRHVSHETLWIWRPHGAGNCPLCLESRQRDETHLLALALCGVLRKRLWTPAWPWALEGEKPKTVAVRQLRSVSTGVAGGKSRAGTERPPAPTPWTGPHRTGLPGRLRC